MSAYERAHFRLTSYQDTTESEARELLNAVVAEALHQAADALDESEVLMDHTDDHMGDVYVATSELRRRADAIKQEEQS